MATVPTTQRGRFLQQAAGSEPPAMPDLPKIPESIKAMNGGRNREDWERFETDLHEFFRKQFFRDRL